MAQEINVTKTCTFYFLLCSVATVDTGLHNHLFSLVISSSALDSLFY